MILCAFAQEGGFMFSITSHSHKLYYTTFQNGARASTAAHRKNQGKDLEFCQPAHLSRKERKELNERRKELEIFNEKIVKAREQNNMEK